jgi:NADH-quinone oxidoreductase subunit N
MMTFFLASLAGIPPLAGWFAKFVMFRSAIDAGTGWGIALAVIAAVNSVIAFFYYFRVVVQMWFHDPATEDRSTVRIPAALGLAMGLMTAVVLVVGIYPQVFARIGEMAF